MKRNKLSVIALLLSLLMLISGCLASCQQNVSSSSDETSDASTSGTLTLKEKFDFSKTTPLALYRAAQTDLMNAKFFEYSGTLLMFESEEVSAENICAKLNAKIAENSAYFKYVDWTGNDIAAEPLPSECNGYNEGWFVGGYGYFKQYYDGAFQKTKSAITYEAFVEDLTESKDTMLLDVSDEKFEGVSFTTTATGAEFTIHFSAEETAELMLGEGETEYKVVFDWNGTLQEVQQTNEWGDSTLRLQLGNISEVQLPADADEFILENGGNDPDTYEEETDFSKYIYEEIDGGIMITGYTGVASYLNIPSEIDGKTVLGIGVYAFEMLSCIKKVTIPDSVTFIEYGAFMNSGIQFAYIGKNVSDIGYQVFDWCASLQQIVVDSDNPYYTSMDGVLYNKDVTTLLQYPAAKPDSSFTVPESVIEIDGIRGYGFLKQLYLGKNVQIVDGFSLLYYSLTSIEVDEANPYLKSIDGTLYTKDGTVLIKYASARSDQEFTIPETVTTIGEDAFTAAEFKTMRIPASVTLIESDAFWQCDSMESLIFDEPSDWYIITEDETKEPIDVSDPAENAKNLSDYDLYAINVWVRGDREI